jgi:hypothetical protein
VSLADIDLSVLHALVETAVPMQATRAHALLFELDPPTDDQLMSEWADVSNAVLVEAEPSAARWFAVQDLLLRRDPGRFARALADRLLALPQELRRLGILQISQVAAHDAQQAARLSSLFD